MPVDTSRAPSSSCTLFALAVGLTWVSACDNKQGQPRAASVEPSSRAVAAPDAGNPGAARPPSNDTGQGVHRPSDAGQSREDTGPATDNLCWEPQDPLLRSWENGSLTKPATLHFCTGTKRVKEITSFAAGHRVHKKTLSLQGKYAFVIHQAPKSTVVLDAYEVKTGKRTGRCAWNVGFATAKGAPYSRLPRLGLTPVPGEGLFLRWGAGTYLTMSLLCKPDGSTPTVGGRTLSPSRRYVATVPREGEPLAGTRGIYIDDLKTGKSIVEMPDAIPKGYVSDIEWKENEATLIVKPYKDRGGEHRKITVPLK